jgi:hypothetical protein
MPAMPARMPIGGVKPTGSVVGGLAQVYMTPPSVAALETVPVPVPVPVLGCVPVVFVVTVPVGEPPVPVLLFAPVETEPLLLELPPLQ